MHVSCHIYNNLILLIIMKEAHDGPEEVLNLLSLFMSILGIKLGFLMLYLDKTMRFQ